MEKIIYPIKLTNKFNDTQYSIIVNKIIRTFYLKSKYRINLFTIDIMNGDHCNINPSRYIDDKKYDKSDVYNEIFTYKITFRNHINIHSIDFDYDYYRLSDWNINEVFNPMLSLEYDNEDIILDENNILKIPQKFLYFSLEDNELFTINKINKAIGNKADGDKSFIKIPDTEYDLKYVYTDRYDTKYYRIVFHDTYYDNLVENDEIFADFNGSSVYPKYEIEIKIL